MGDLRMQVSIEALQKGEDYVQDATVRQFDELLCRKVKIHDDKAETLIKQRLQYIGKLFVDMKIDDDIDRKQVPSQIDRQLYLCLNSHTDFDNNQDELIIRLKNIDTNEFVEIDKQNIEDIKTVTVGDKRWIQITDKTQKSIYNVINLGYSPNQHRWFGGCLGVSIDKHNVYILKILKHSRQNEIFYKCFINTDQNISGTNVIIQKDTMQQFQINQAVQICLPVNIDTCNGAKDGLDEHDEIRQVSDSLVKLEHSKEVEGLAEQGLDEIQIGCRPQELASDQESRMNIDDRWLDRTGLKVETIQPIEEYFKTMQYDYEFNDATEYTGKQAEEDLEMFVVKQNVDKFTKSIVDSGLLDIQDFPEGFRQKEKDILEFQLTQFCYQLYPAGIEVSLVDMLQLFRVMVQNIFRECNRYKRFVKSCYNADMTKCNFKKRDGFQKAVKHNVSNQLDLEQKRFPEKFIDPEKKYKYSFEGTEYQLTDIGMRAIVGFETQFKLMLLGNICAEQEENRKMQRLR